SRLPNRSCMAGESVCDRPHGELALAEYASAPQKWEGLLAAELTEAGTAQDEDLAAAAKALMVHVDQPGAKSDKYNVTIKAARRASRAANAASLSRSAWRSITSRQFVGYGPALSVAAGPAGPGRAYRPRPVLERKPRRVHSASWVSRFRGCMPSRLASSLPDQSWPGWPAMMRVTWSLLLPGQGGRGPGGWFARRGRAAGRSGGGTRMVICTRVIVTAWQGRSWPRSWSRTW